MTPTPSPLTWLREWWSRRTCPHYWRPARTSKGAARHCPLCETTQQLTEEMFYAYFGRVSK